MAAAPSADNAAVRKGIAKMQLENVVHIDAPTDVVWDVTIDLERWPQWTPTVRSIERVDAGAVGVGSAALVGQPGLPRSRWTVTAFTPGERFVWETRARGIHMIGSHEMTPESTGTRSTLRIQAHGFVARFLWPLIRSSIRRSLERENAGLKSHCESIARERCATR